MTPNPFDQASRYLTKKNPQAMLSWLLPGWPETLAYEGWLDTRSIPFPGEPDRVCDTVAHMVEAATTTVHWALTIEFQLKPDRNMFGRLLEYLGDCGWSRAYQPYWDAASTSGRQWST